jgi:hypothetical protein
MGKKNKNAVADATASGTAVDPPPPFEADGVETSAAPQPTPAAASTVGERFRVLYCTLTQCNGTAVIPRDSARMHEGAQFYAILPDAVPRVAEDFGSESYKYLVVFMGPPYAPGRMLAPHEFAKGSKKSKDQLMALNKSGKPLSEWANPGNKNEIRFYTCEKNGFNRGNRLDAETWTYAGGDVFKFSIESKVVEPVPSFQDANKMIPPFFFLDQKFPENEAVMAPFSLVLASIAPKTAEGCRKTTRACFNIKGCGVPGARTIASILPHLQDTMPSSLEEAIARAEATIRATGSDIKPYSHQVGP